MMYLNYIVFFRIRLWGHGLSIGLSIGFRLVWSKVCTRTQYQCVPEAVHGVGDPVSSLPVSYM